ncbi:DUF308 domain-containing protein [Leucobacter sp. cx-42]|nr:DUF308 domain-containing protein [Leucobacter sp. cx-42]
MKGVDMSVSAQRETVTTGSAQESVSRLAPRGVRIARAIVLFAVGMIVTFSATMHSNFNFDFLVTAGGLAIIGIMHLVEWFARKDEARSVMPLLLGLVSLVATVVLPMTGEVVGYAIIVAVWALISGLLEFVAMVTQPGTRQDPALIGAAGLLLAILVLLARNDAVAVLGFFGAYTIIAGVFLGIAAFDSKRNGVSAAQKSE